MKVFLDANYVIYLKYAESDEVFDYCVGLYSQLPEKIIHTKFLYNSSVIRWLKPVR